MDIQIPNYTPEVKPSQTKPERKHKPWKFYLFGAFVISMIVLVNAWPPVKATLHDIGLKIISFGWIGPFLLLLFIGTIIIPFALPYFIFEMTIALVIQNFFYAVCFAITGKTIGASMCYLATKYLLRDRIREYVQHIKTYKGIEYMIQTNPIKFSLIFRIIILPLPLKNYGLALPDCINYKIYILCSFLPGLVTTSMSIYVMRRAGDISSFFDGSQAPVEVIFSIIMIIVSICLFVYIFIYTRRTLKEIESFNEHGNINFLQNEIEMPQITASSALNRNSTKPEGL